MYICTHTYVLDAIYRCVDERFYQSSTIRIIHIIFWVLYARILTNETLSCVYHIVAKNTWSVCTTIRHLNDSVLEKVNTENTLTN